MQTDKIRVGSGGLGREAALSEADKFAAYVGLEGKQALRMRLLSEEALCMVEAITGDFQAQFWLESTPERMGQIHLEARTKMDYFKRQELLRSSTDHKNAAAKGVMGRVLAALEDGFYGYGGIQECYRGYIGTPMTYGMMGMSDLDGLSAMQTATVFWSLGKYRNDVAEAKEEEPEAQEAMDELERSIVANIADDVRVAVHGDKVEMVIEKKL